MEHLFSKKEYMVKGDYEKLSLGDWVMRYDEYDDKIDFILGYVIEKNEGYIAYKTLFPVNKRNREYADHYDELFKFEESLDKEELEELVNLSLDLKDKKMFEHYSELLKYAK